MDDSAKTWKEIFLEHLAESPNVSAACRAAWVSRAHVYKLRKEDAGFAREWDDALEESIDNLVGEAYRRAFKGTLKPVFQMGKRVGAVREYSDALTIKLLTAHRPGVYGSKSQVDVTSGGEKVRTIIYLPDNGRDEPDGGDPPAAGAAGEVPPDVG